MDRLPSVGNGYVAPREAGPGRRSHTQGGADRTAWTRLSTVVLSDSDDTSLTPAARHFKTKRPRHVSIPTKNRSRLVPLQQLLLLCCRRHSRQVE